jgi:colanic acid biosynthesis glycosyl transferase WcaI
VHILLITTYFAPDGGAAPVRLTRLARQLQARGHNVTVLTAMPHYPHGIIPEGYRRKLTTTETIDGVTIIRTWLWTSESNRISRRLISQISLMVMLFLRGLFLPRPDVVLIEAQPMFTNFAGSLLSRLKRVPYVQNVSDLWPDHLLSVGKMTENHPAYRLLRTLVDATYRGAAEIVAMSPAWAEAIERYVGKSDKLTVIYNGVDLTRFSPDVDGGAFKAKHGLEGERMVGFIGAFTTQNDFTTMLDAAKRLQHLDDTIFVFIGGGAQVEVVHNRLLEGDLSNVRYLGWIEHDDIPQAWASLEVMILALRNEPLYAGTVPAKFFEAMASGVPIAAAVQGVAAEMIEESGAGIAVSCGDVEGLARAVEQLLDDGQAAGEAARRYAETHFDPERVTQMYESLLKRAAKE